MEPRQQDLKRGEIIVKEITERVTLKLFRIGCERTNYEILKNLPADIKELMGKFELSKMPMNKRINELEEVGLLKRDRYEGKVSPTPLTKTFLGLIEELKKDILKELPKLI